MYEEFVTNDNNNEGAKTPKRARKKEADQDDSWMYVLHSQKVKPRDCDEVPDEFVKAGIGLCFEGIIAMERCLKNDKFDQFLWLS